MSMQSRLLTYGHSPAYLEVSNQEFINLTKGKIPHYRQKWKRIPHDARMIFQKGEEGLELEF